MTKKNEIALYGKDQFLCLAQGGDHGAAMTALAESGETIGPEDLIRVKTPSGGATKWIVPGPTGEAMEDEIVGALVHYQMCGVLWPSDEPQEGTLPVLRTFDMKTAEQIGPIPDEMAKAMEPFRTGEKTFNIAESSGFPYTQWGSDSRGGKGKAFKEQRMMFVLRPGDMTPLVLVVQPGSLKNVTKWFKQSALTTGAPWFRWVVGLGLRKEKSANGQPYAQVVPRVVEVLDPETGLLLRKQWGEMLAGIARELDIDGDDDL